MATLIHSLAILAFASLSSLHRASGHGYMTTPRSRNLLAFQETVWWPQTENDPQPETCPHCLNRGGSLAQCGIAQELRNYDTPLNALGGPMPTNQQAIYYQGQGIVIDVTLTAHHKGHFEFAACPVAEGEIPTKECFDNNKLMFVEDLMYGANYDPNYPHRAYIAPVNVAVTGEYVPNYGTTEGLMDFKFKMRLPENVYGDLVLIQWYYLTANSCIHNGYAEYDWKEGWRNDSMSASMCGEVSADGDGAPEQFWNCAETRILAKNAAQATNTTVVPTNKPTNPPTFGVQSASVAIPVSSIDTSALASTPKINSSGRSKTIVGYYASWQWYDRNKLAAPGNMDFTKVDVVNYAFFQTDTNGNIWGTDSWGDPNVLFGPYDWNPSESSKEFCSWDSPTDRPCNYHKYQEGLIHLVHSAGALLYPSLGGWTLSDAFPAMAANPTARANFAKNCVELIQAYDFDGIDIDWEYPGFEEHSGTPNDKDSFRLLLDEVRTQLDILGSQTGRFYGLTAALPCGPQHIANMDTAHVASTLTFLNLMSYDFHGAFSATTGTNAPLYYQGWGEEGFSVHDCVNNWVAGGAAREKINIGLPFYGRSFATATDLNTPHDGADQTVWGIDDGTPQYFNIMAQLPSMNHIWHKQSWTDWASFSSGGSVSFDSENAICAKTQYAIDNTLHGFIVWELSGDLMSDLSTPLLDITNKKLSDPSFVCGEFGLYPQEVTADAMPVTSPSISNQQPSTLDVLPNEDATPSAPISGMFPSPSVGNVPTVSNPSSSVNNGGQPASSSNGNLPMISNPANPDSNTPFIHCKDNSSSSDPKPVELSFKYELHRHPLISSTAAMEDVKSSMLHDIAGHFKCKNDISSSSKRSLSSLRNNLSAQGAIVAFMSPPQDTRSDSPCSVTVDLDTASICDSIDGSLTVFLDHSTPESTVQELWQELIFTIRTGMAAGRYETSKVLKAVFIKDTTADQSQANVSASMVAWAPESDSMSTSSIILVVFCVLIVVGTVAIQFMFFKRSKKPAPSDAVENVDDSIASSVSKVESVWKKALDTYDTRGGTDLIGGYVADRTLRTEMSDNFSDNGHEVELANDVGHDEHLQAFDKASKGHDPPDSDDEVPHDGVLDKAHKAESSDPPGHDDDELSEVLGESDSSGDWSDLYAMELVDLKMELETHGVNCTGMIEREEFIKAVKGARRRKVAIESGSF